MGPRRAIYTSIPHLLTRRYGFVNEPLRNRSDTRLALIPSAPLTKIPKLPSKSPIPPGTAPPQQTNFGPHDGPEAPVPASPDDVPGTGERSRQKESERVNKWMDMMSVRRRDEGGNIIEWGWKKESRAKVVKRVYKGIPDRWRMAAWWTLAEDQVAKVPGKGKGGKPADVLANEYNHAIDLPSSHDVQIDLDVPRTISGHTLFVTRYGSGQRNLFKVLHAFSLVCDTCGYCQGMGPIAATLLCYYDPEVSPPFSWMLSPAYTSECTPSSSVYMMSTGCTPSSHRDFQVCSRHSMFKNG